MEQPDEHLGVPRVVPCGLDRGGDERMVRPGRDEITLEHGPRALGMPLGEGQEGEVAARARRPGVGDDGAQPRDTPTDSCQRRRLRNSRAVACITWANSSVSSGHKSDFCSS